MCLQVLLGELERRTRSPNLSEKENIIPPSSIVEVFTLHVTQYALQKFIVQMLPMEVDEMATAGTAKRRA